jgi:hypothetical protein
MYDLRVRLLVRICEYREIEYRIDILLKEKLLTLNEFMYWVVQKRRKFSPNFYSLPVMFESNLKKREESRCLADALGGCLAGIR